MTPLSAIGCGASWPQAARRPEPPRRRKNRGFSTDVKVSFSPRRGGTDAPGLGEIGGYTLESLFAENLNADLERMQQINEMIGLMTPWRRRSSGRRRIEVMVIRPSQDVRVIAARFLTRFPRHIRLFMRAIGGWGNEWRLPSYLLFEGAFTQALIELGYRDGLKQRPMLEAFFA